MRDLRDAINAGIFNPEDVEPAVPSEMLNDTKKKLQDEIEQLQDEINKKKKMLAEITNSNLEKDAPSVNSFYCDAIARMMRRAEGKELPIPLPWPTVAEKLNGGLWPGEYVLVGNTGSGKSQWALQVALNAATQRIPCLYVGLELGKDDLIARMLGMLAGRKWSTLWLGKNQAELADIATQYGPQLIKMPIHTVVAPPYGWSYTKLYEIAEAMRKEYKNLLLSAEGYPKVPMLVVVDFLQIVASPPGQREDLRYRIQQTAYAARAVARDLDAAIIMVSSTSRENYALLDGASSYNDSGSQSKEQSRKTPPPSWERPATFLVGLGKESGEVEYSADYVLVLAKEPWHGNAPPAEGSIVHLGIAKARAGTPGEWSSLKFDGGRFEENHHSNSKVAI